MIDLILFKNLMNTTFNLDLFSYKEEQLNRRLNSYFERNGITDIIEYVEKLRRDNTALNKFLDFMTINVTEFYRNPELFNDVTNIIKNYQNKRMRIWSAACSNGCEPYSIAIILNELGYTNSTIIGTDLDVNILEKAKMGEYEQCDVRNVPSDILNKYFKKDNNKYYISPLIKKYVIFRKHDLLVDPYEKEYDLIVCRNVVIYFNSDAKDSLYKKMSDSLKKNGIFFVGATESIHNYNDFNLIKENSFIYRKK